MSFTYYSNYDGCKEVSRAAINFTDGMEGLMTGRRYFSAERDLYRFTSGVRLSFANSTGNTSGLMTFEGETVEVQCQIRDYSYEDCQ